MKRNWELIRIHNKTRNFKLSLSGLKPTEKLFDDIR